MTKFPEMPYSRPDTEAIKAQLTELTARFAEAASYEAAKAVFDEKEALEKTVQTAYTIAHVRNTIDTRDTFYDEEIKFWNAAMPELEEYLQNWTSAMLASPFRADFAAEFGDLMFVNAEIQRRTFSPEIIPEMKQENDLATEYEKLLASAQVPFEGSNYTLAQMTLFKSDPDDARRLSAWKAEGQWYKDNQQALDSLYHDLVQLRDTMGKKLGHKDYVALGYDRMGRNCYTRTDIEAFRAAVQKYVVPVAEHIYRIQAQRLGVAYPMSFSDAALQFRSGNPRPQGDADAIVAQASKFYDELSPETSEFWRTMCEGDLLDLLSKEGKRSGGYCTGIPDYGVPFIFANFNGTQGDVEVVTHEAGHGFAYYMNRDRKPLSACWPGMESCEVHSMSMEFMAWPWAEGFFGADTRKFLLSHLCGTIVFIPYGTMVDHFQHEAYDHPEYTPAQRHAVWKKLMGIYMPWIRLDGEIPFYAEGEHWQLKHHIYSSPFYYIDYCLAQTVSLEFWAMLQHDPKGAWEKYMAYTRQGGSENFVGLLKNAGLSSPFVETTLQGICAEAKNWLDNYDMTGLF